MNIAIITGASSGLGIEYLKCICELCKGIEEIWIIARRREKLEELSRNYPDRKIIPIALDLTEYDSYEKLRKMLSEASANVKVLVNNAGYGILGDLHTSDPVKQSGMVDLNCRALTALTAISLKYMQRDSFIINVCSIASFCPNARMSVYSSTKAYVKSFSRAVRFENKKRGINVLAVCPGPMKTEFLDVAGISGNSKTFETLPYSDPAKTAKGSVIAARKGRAFYTPGVFYKFYRLLAKITPHSLMMYITKT